MKRTYLFCFIILFLGCMNFTVFNYFFVVKSEDFSTRKVNVEKNDLEIKKVNIKTISSEEDIRSNEVKGTEKEIKREPLVSRGDEERTTRYIKYGERREYTDSDLYWLSRIVNSEAPNESDEGQIAVANVVLNRLDKKWAGSIKDVVFQKINGTYQFTPVENGSIHNNPSKRSINNSKKALNGRQVVPRNVLYFYMPTNYNKNDWIRSREIYKKIGCHNFCF